MIIGYANSMFTATHGILARPSGGGFDPDAQAFITAAVITDVTQQNAINTLVVDLKGYSIWTKMQALYPFVGGTATTHKFNLKNPLDTNAAFRIFWSGGVTHSSNGVQFGGVNGRGDTYLTPSTSLSLNSTHISFYSRTNTAVGSIEIGSSANLGFAPYLLMQIKSTTNNLGIHINDGTAAFVSNSDGRGLYIVNRTASNIRNSFKNATKVINDTQASTGLNSNSIWIGAYNTNGSSPLYSNKECAFASIGDGLTDAEAANFYTAVQAFQTTLSRQV